jgi:hypothetical protein
MSKHNVFVIPSNIPAAYPQETVNDVKSTIQDRLDNMQAKADDAFNKALGYVDTIKELMDGISLADLPDLTLDCDIDDIVSKLLENMPDAEDLRQAIDDFDMPDEPALDIPSVDSSALVDQLVAYWMNKISADGTGLGTDIETQIWENFIDRQQTDDARLIYEAENYFASKGFTLPPGMLQGKMNEIYLDIAKRNTQQNKEITIEQARLAQTNTHLLLTESYKAGIGVLSDYCDRLVKTRKSYIDEYLARIEYLKIKVIAYSAKVEALAKFVSSNSTIFAALASAAGTEIQAKLGVAELKLKKAIAEADIDMKEMEYDIERAKQYFALKIEAARTAANVLAQLAASALASVNTSASVGVQASVANSSQVAVSASWQDSDSYSESIQKVGSI